MPAHSWVSHLFSGRSYSASTLMMIFSTAIGSLSCAAISVGSGLWSESILLSVQNAGYHLRPRSLAGLVWGSYGFDRVLVHRNEDRSGVKEIGCVSKSDILMR